MQIIHKGPTTALCADLTLTGTLAASTSECDVSLASYVDLHVDYAQGTGGTSPKLELVVEVQCEGSTTWRQPSTGSPGTPSGGAVVVELVTVTYQLAASGNVVLPVPCYGASRLRVKVRETGAPSPYGTVNVRAVPSRVGA